MYKNDRRIFERFEVDFSAQIRHLGAQVNSPARCCDISAGGTGLFTEEGLIPGLNLEFQLGIPNGHQPLQGFARVVWCKQVHETRWRSGLEFKKKDFMGVRRIFETEVKKD